MTLWPRERLIGQRSRLPSNADTLSVVAGHDPDFENWCADCERFGVEPPSEDEARRVMSILSRCAATDAGDTSGGEVGSRVLA
jgi:hypothetical protein